VLPPEDGVPGNFLRSETLNLELQTLNLEPARVKFAICNEIYQGWKL